MSKTARSARGVLVDFDLLAIKQQLASTPAPKAVEQRRRFIDEKDGIKTRTTLPGQPKIDQSEIDTVEISESPVKKHSSLFPASE